MLTSPELDHSAATVLMLNVAYATVWSCMCCKLSGLVSGLASSMALLIQKLHASTECDLVGATG